MSEDNESKSAHRWWTGPRVATMFFLLVVVAMGLWTMGGADQDREATGELVVQAHSELDVEAHSELDVEALFLSGFHERDSSRASASSDPCLTCHEAANVMEGITQDWKGSKHSQVNVSCIDCHQAKSTDPDAQSHNGYTISPIVSPLDCARCHSEAVEQNNQSLHALGSLYYEFLYDKQALPYLESQVHGEFPEFNGKQRPHAATLRGCQACHGTNMTGQSVDDFEVWPNNGIGRINPDGSVGSCAACHSRHSFSVEEARKPETCGQCHMGPDHPQIEMYMESKHGNIYASEGDTWNWSDPDWTAGVDYRAPTCASCHMSAAPGVAATHDISSRLSWELESPVSRHTDNVANSLGVEFGDGTTWQVKRARMQAVCNQCHGDTWVENYYDQADLVVELYNEQYLASKEVVDGLRTEGLLTPQNFDEQIEFEIYEMWHHEGRRARMGAFMMGPDYVQWHGLYDVLIDKVEIEELAAKIRAAANESGLEIPETYVMVFLASNGFDGKVYLQWDFDGPEAADHYDIYWSSSVIDDISGLTANSANVTDQTYVATGLSANTTYHFAVAAIDGDGQTTDVAYSSAVPTVLEVQPTGNDNQGDDSGADSSAPFFITVVLLVVGLAAIRTSSRKER